MEHRARRFFRLWRSLTIFFAPSSVLLQNLDDLLWTSYARSFVVFRLVSSGIQFMTTFAGLSSICLITWPPASLILRAVTISSITRGKSRRRLLQAVFVVCVNLQGLFIFCFHCVRNTTVRSEWKSVVSRIQTYTTTTSNIDPAGSRRGGIPLRPISCDTDHLQPRVKDTRLWQLQVVILVPKTTLCLKKRPAFTTCYNFYIHSSITTILT